MKNDVPAGALMLGIDESDHSHLAADWAADQARRQHRPLVVVQAFDAWSEEGWPSEHRTELVRERRAAAVEQLRGRHPDLDIHQAFELGDPRMVLIDASKVAHHLVVGSRGRGRVASLLLGSVSAAVVAHAECPVSVIRPYHPGAVHRGVVVGIDDSPEAPLVLEHAFTEASERSLPLTVRHCVWTPGAGVTGAHLMTDHDPYLGPARLVVAEALAGFGEKYPDVPVTIEVASGFPEHALVPGSETFSLLVIGRHHHALHERVLRASVATGVVERARCPVLVVPV